MTNLEFDVYKLQTLIFSVVVAIALLASGEERLSSFTVPDTLLGILGLSQVVLVLDHGTNHLHVRQLVQERVAAQSRTLPALAKPPVILESLSTTSRVMKSSTGPACRATWVPGQDRSRVGIEQR